MLNPSFRREARTLCVNLVIVPIFRKDSSLRIGVTGSFIAIIKCNASNTENYPCRTNYSPTFTPSCL